MKISSFQEALFQGATEIGVQLSESQIHQFFDYYNLLTFWNRSINLTAISGEMGVIEKHFLDSLLYSKLFPENFLELKFLDIGSGAGFPGLPLKIAFPDLNVLLMEPSFKRTSFLHAVNSKLQLHVKIVESKAEDWLKNNSFTFDIMTLRAVGRLEHFLETLLPYLNPSGKIIVSGQPEMVKLTRKMNAVTQLTIEPIPFKNHFRSFILITKQ